MSGHDESLDEATLILDEVFSHGTVDLSDRFLGDSCVPIIDVLRQRDTAHSIILKVSVHICSVTSLLLYFCSHQNNFFF